MPVGARSVPIWVSREGLLVALEAPPDQAPARGHKKLLLLGLLVLLQAVSSYHVDRNRTKRELLGCSWSRPALPYIPESHTGQIYFYC